MSPRPALPEDFDFDPSYRRIRAISSTLLAVAINMARNRGHMREPNTLEDRMKQIDFVEKAAVDLGIIQFDDFHHAPLCDANHYHRMRMPIGPCTCGAAEDETRARRGG